MSGKRKQASSSKSEEEEKTQPVAASKAKAAAKQTPQQQAAKPAAGKVGKVPPKAEAAESEPEEEADDAENDEEDGAEDMYDEEELAAAAAEAEEDAFYEEGDEDAEGDGDSGYDTDEVISFARQSGAIDHAAAKEKKKKDKKQKKGQQQQEEEEAAEEINVEFQFFDPRPDDRYAVKDLLRTFIGSDEKQFNAERLATVICEQVAIGTMVKTEDPAEQPIGFATILNMHQHKDLEPVAQIRKFLLAKCPEAQRPALQRLLDDTSKQLGLFIHERVINLPSELVPDLHTAVFDDLKWAAAEAKKSKDPEDREFGKLIDYEHLLLVSKCFYEDVLDLPVEDDDDSDSDAEEAKAQPPRKKTKGASSSSSSSSSSGPAEGPSRSLTEGTAYFKYEDESYEQASVLSFRFPMPTPQAVTPSESLPQVGVACVVHKSKIPGVLERIRSVLKEDYQE